MKLEHIYIISLKADSKEYYNHVVNELGNMGLKKRTSFTIVPAFDGRFGEVPEGFSTYKGWNLGAEEANSWWSRPVTPGEVGCSVSHWKVWEKIAKSNGPCIVLEEDFKIQKEVGNIASIGIREDMHWDLAYLGRNKVQADKVETDIGHGWFRPSPSYNTHAYILTPKGAKELLAESFKTNLIPADEYFCAVTSEHERSDIRNLFNHSISAIAPAQDFIRQANNLSTTEPATGLLDVSNWEAWKTKYLQKSAMQQQWDLIVDEPIPFVYELPLFTDAFCKEAIELAEAADKWTIDRHEHYPTNDVLLPEIGLDDIYNRVLKEFVMPMCIAKYTLEGRGWDDMSSENFLARYTTERQSHLALHHDFSHISAVVKLNDDFDGGGTYFPGFGKVLNPARIGTIAVHPGMITHRHGGRPIYSGKRYILTSFMANTKGSPGRG